MISKGGHFGSIKPGCRDRACLVSRLAQLRVGTPCTRNIGVTFGLVPCRSARADALASLPLDAETELALFPDLPISASKWKWSDVGSAPVLHSPSKQPPAASKPAVDVDHIIQPSTAQCSGRPSHSDVKFCCKQRKWSALCPFERHCPDKLMCFKACFREEI